MVNQFGVTMKHFEKTCFAPRIITVDFLLSEKADISFVCYLDTNHRMRVILLTVFASYPCLGDGRSTYKPPKPDRAILAILQIKGDSIGRNGAEVELTASARKISVEDTEAAECCPGIVQISSLSHCYASFPKISLTSTAGIYLSPRPIV